MARKTDNDSMLQVQQQPKTERQLSLIRVVREEEPRPSNPLVDAIIADMKRQEVEGMTIADELYPGHGFTRTQDMPTSIFREIWKEYHQRNPGPQPLDIPDDDSDDDDTPTRKPKKPKRFQEWPIERKWQERLKRLHQLSKKLYSLTELYCHDLQQRAVNNPQYFGVCPLPGAIDSSKLNLSDLLPNPAKEFEKALREQEILEYEIKYEGKQALALPVQLKTPELVQVQTTNTVRLP